jgi:ABC-type uncharacterized transport system substrate-binding protein
MRRREFIAMIGGVVASPPLVARAQQATIGFLHSGSQQEWAHALAALHGSLKESGYVAGQNVTIEYRWADDQFDRLPTLSADLVSRKPALIVVGGGSIAALSVKRATTTIPVVFAIGADPVRMGLVSSLNRPGGNVTGVTFLLNALVAKRLDLLRQLEPSIKLIGMFVNPANPNARTDMDDAEAAARQFGLRTLAENVGSENEIEPAFQSLRRQKADALILLPDPNFVSRRDRIVALATRYSLPAMYFGREFVASGGLMSYSSSVTDAYRLAGGYAGRLLKGEKPADLPVVQPTRFEFVINLKTAKALGLTVPPTLLATADEVIE